MIDENTVTSIEDLQNIDLDSIETDEQDATEDNGQEDETPTEHHVEDDSVSEFTPNFKYKVKDEEFDFDDRVQSVIKTQDDEDYFRDIYTRAGGIDSYKQKVNDYESKVTELTSGVDELSQGFHKIKTLRDDGNMSELVHTLGIKEDDIVNYALELAKKNQLPQEERERITQNQTFERENTALKSRLDSLEAQNQTNMKNSQAQNDFQELQGLVSQDSSLANAMKGKGLDLQAEIINTGMSEFGRRGEDISIVDAFNLVKQKYGWLEQVPNQEVAPVIDQKQSLPIVKGGSSAPVSDEITSIDQLQKLYDSKFS